MVASAGPSIFDGRKENPMRNKAKKKTAKSNGAAAVLDVPAVNVAPETAGETIKEVDPVSSLIPFYVIGFKLEDSPRTYQNEKSREQSTRVARAVCQLRGSSFCFLVNISRIKSPQGSGFRASLPSIGRGGTFRESVIFTDDNGTRAALDQWKIDLIRNDFSAWYKANKGKLQESLKRPQSSSIITAPDIDGEDTETEAAETT